MGRGASADPAATSATAIPVASSPVAARTSAACSPRRTCSRNDGPSCHQCPNSSVSNGVATTPGTPVRVRCAASVDTTSATNAFACSRTRFGTIPAALLDYPKADLYLLFDPDVPWVEDGTRLFGSASERARFAALAEDLLRQTGVRLVRISGSWAERESSVRDVLVAAAAY